MFNYFVFVGNEWEAISWQSQDDNLDWKVVSTAWFLDKELYGDYISYLME